MRKTAIIVGLALLAALAASPQGGATQEKLEGQSAAEIFDETLAREGIEAAVAKFREMMADTSGAYDFDQRELVRASRELIWKEKRDEGIELLQLLTEVYPGAHWPWVGLGIQHLMLANGAQAESCLARALELQPDPYVDWVLQNIHGLLEITGVQVMSAGLYAPGQNLGIHGPFLGEEPPGGSRKVFANGILCTTPNEFSITFTPDDKEIYFSRAGVGVLVCRWEDEGWTAPQVIELAGDSLLVDEPSVAPDGSKIFFNGRPSLADDRFIYQAERVGDGWGEPQKLFPGMYATSTLDGTLYYTETTGRPDYGVIARRRLTDSGYSEPEVLEGGVNTSFLDAHPYIAPDESFILFDSNRDRTCSLYVCFLQGDGSWSEAVCLDHHLGIPPYASQCSLSPGGEYLFFSLLDDIYWISAEVLKDLRPEQ